MKLALRLGREDYDVSRQIGATLKPGKNVVAVHVSQTGGGQYIDVGLVLDPKQKLIVPVAPLDPGELERLRDARWSEEEAWTWYYEKVGKKDYIDMFYAGNNDDFYKNVSEYMIFKRPYRKFITKNERPVHMSNYFSFFILFYSTCQKYT